ncbi:MAG: hypothetical protein ACSHW9_13320, partial [Salinibacterium amurskyense]
MPHEASATPASINIEQHLSRVLAAVTPLPVVAVPLAQAVQLTLAEDVRAAINVPGFDNSAMDGYALRWADAAAATPE